MFCLVFVAWLRLPTPVRLVPARNGAISFAPHNTPAVVVLGKRFWRDWCQPLLKVVILYTDLFDALAVEVLYAQQFEIVVWVLRSAVL